MPSPATEVLAPESRLMRALRRMGRDDLAWPLRRLHVPVGPEALVLEVGSGGNPYPRANVLLDAYEVTGERHFAPLVADRPCVLARGEKLPFRDGAFDFVIASHVLEHATDAPAFLSELQRVARAGYIETPDALFERLNPYLDHRLEVTSREGRLLLREKRARVPDPELVELYEARLKRSARWMRLLREDPFSFHLRHYWSRAAGGIRYELVRLPPGEAPAFSGGDAVGAPTPPPSRGARQLLVAAARGLFSQPRRNARLDLADLLRCPDCGGDAFASSPHAFTCRGCGRERRRRGQLVDLTG
jgi:hypothetical protein